MRNTVCVLLLIFSGCMSMLDREYPPINFTGDGTFYDRGRKCGTERFILDFGTINLKQKGTYEYTFKGVPSVKYNFGIGFDYDVRHTPAFAPKPEWARKVKIEMSLTDESDGKILFSVKRVLADLTWTNACPVRYGALAYGRDIKHDKNNEKTQWSVDPEKEYKFKVVIHSEHRNAPGALACMSGGGWHIRKVEPSLKEAD